MHIKSIILINGDSLIKKAWLKALTWASEYNITNEKDIIKMTYYQNIINIIETYTNNKNKFIVFYYNEEKWKDNKKRFLKKIASILPTFVSNMSYKSVCSMLQTDCPEYDEIVANWISNVTIYDMLIKICKKERFNSLHKELKQEIKKALHFVI